MGFCFFRPTLSAQSNVLYDIKNAYLLNVGSGGIRPIITHHDYSLSIIEYPILEYIGYLTEYPG